MSELLRVHWSPVEPRFAPAYAPDGHELLALWPAPVNLDECFMAAGFADFADHEQAWDDAAEALLERVLHELESHGPARLLSPPLCDHVPWYLRPFREARPAPLLQQALQPMHWDSLPHFRARFGPGEVTLRTGNGHFLLWLTVPSAPIALHEAMVARVAAPWPATRTVLDWSPLLPSGA